MKKSFYLKARRCVCVLMSVTLIFLSFGFMYAEDNPEYPKFAQRLLERFSELPEGEAVDVMIWFTDIDNEAREADALEILGFTPETWEDQAEKDELDEETIDSYISLKRSLAVERYNEHNGQIVAGLFDDAEIEFVSQYSPVIIAKMTFERLVEISDDERFVFADEYAESLIECQSLTDMKNSIKATNVHASTPYHYTGSGIKIGMVDLGQPVINTVSYIRYNDVNPSTSNCEHADEVIQILSKVAPDATFYCAPVWNGTPFNSSSLYTIEWLIGRGVNIIVSGCSIGNDAVNQYGMVSAWIDHIAYQDDVHFVMPAGNWVEENGASSASGIVSGGMAYNAITVGNVNTNGTPTIYSDDYRCITSSYNSSVMMTNPNSCKKPDICAAGTSLVTMHGVATGTSYSAPQVAGALALICQSKSILKTRQDAAKAILLASVNFDSPLADTPTGMNYMATGAGFLDCVGAAWVAKNGRFKYGSISTNTTYKSYTFNVTSSDTRIRVALTYLKNNHIDEYWSHSSYTPTDPVPTHVDETPIARLHIAVYAPGSSTPLSTHYVHNGTNVDIWDFVPSVTGTYTVRVYRDSALATTYYGLAWR
ncbi:MAG: S8 family serine peptidase, partial [Clostridia bacterium]|nr:S8 family serine peptidase [Clostridia bacterium]